MKFYLEMSLSADNWDFSIFVGWSGGRHIVHVQPNAALHWAGIPETMIWQSKATVD